MPQGSFDFILNFKTVRRSQTLDWNVILLFRSETNTGFVKILYVLILVDDLN